MGIKKFFESIISGGGIKEIDGNVISEVIINL